MPGTNSPDSRHLINVGCGTLTALFGAVLIGGTAVSFGKDHSPAGDLVMGFLFGVLPFALGIWWVVRTLRGRQRAAWERTERVILRLAQQKGGVLTALEAAAETDLSFDEAKRYLDRLADQGHVDVTPTEAGLAYRFPGAA